MARPRSELHEILVAIPDVVKVYFQPPNNTRLVYPCIIYNRDNEGVSYADNLPLVHSKRYTITVIDPEVDSLIPDRVRELPMCAFDRFYTADDLNHDVFTLYF